MGLIGSSDLDRMRADATVIRQDNLETIAIRRGNTTLAAQQVRIARISGQANRQDTLGGEEVRGRVIVVGSVDFDVQPGDRFNDSSGVLYRVFFVRPNRNAAVMAEAEAVE